jgi:hypothetical protein
MVHFCDLGGQKPSQWEAAVVGTAQHFGVSRATVTRAVAKFCPRRPTAGAARRAKGK